MATTRSDDYSSVQAVLLDIEGTTTSIKFVKDGLFPFVRTNIAEHIKKNLENEEFKKVVDGLKAQADEEIKAGVEGVTAVDDGKLEETLSKYVFNLMDRDSKTSPLKDLQGHIWRDGYKAGLLKGHVYSDVADTLKEWSEGGRKIYIYSSGSVEAQKLLFGHSEAGNLLELINGHFDTAIGAKTSPESYSAIAKDIGLNEDEILFLTDVAKEAEAARTAGITAALVVREGNAPLTEEDKVAFNTINSLAEIVLPSSAKRAKIVVEDAHTPAPDTAMDVDSTSANEPEPAKAEEVAEPVVEENKEAVAEAVKTPEPVVETPEEAEVAQPDTTADEKEPEAEKMEITEVKESDEKSEVEVPDQSDKSAEAEAVPADEKSKPATEEEETKPEASTTEPEDEASTTETDEAEASSTATEAQASTTETEAEASAVETKPEASAAETKPEAETNGEAEAKEEGNSVVTKEEAQTNGAVAASETNGATNGAVASSGTNGDANGAVDSSESNGKANGATNGTESVNGKADGAAEPKEEAKEVVEPIVVKKIEDVPQIEVAAE